MGEKNFKGIFSRFSRKLEKAGLPDKLKPTGVPISKKLKREASNTLDPRTEGFLMRLGALPDDVQDEIRKKLQEHEDSGVSGWGILGYLEILISKAEDEETAREEMRQVAENDFDNLPTDVSDKNYRPKSSQKQDEMAEGAEWISSSVDARINQVEKSIEEERKVARLPKKLH